MFQMSYQDGAFQIVSIESVQGIFGLLFGELPAGRKCCCIQYVFLLIGKFGNEWQRNKAFSCRFLSRTQVGQSTNKTSQQ